MRVVCPQCGERVELALRHGLTGSLCPQCNEVVTPPTGASTPRPRPRPVAAAAVRERPVCPGCGLTRDRDARRCEGCGTPWTYRTVVVGFVSDDAPDRLLVYVMRRSPGQRSSAGELKRLTQLPAVVQGGLTETQARRAKQEIEAFGALGRVEPDADARVARPLHTSGGLRLALLAVAAVLALGTGVRLLLTRAPAPTSSRPAVAPPPVARRAPAGAPDEVLASLVALGDDAMGFYVDLDGWILAPDGAASADGTVRVGEATAHRLRSEEQGGVALFKSSARPAFAATLGDATSLSAGEKVWVPVRDGVGWHLGERRVRRPDLPDDRRVFVALEGVGALLPGTPVFDGGGGVVAIAGRGAVAPDRGTLVLPINVLTEGEHALLGDVKPPRAPSARFVRWQRAAADADRVAHPDLYGLIDTALLLEVRCPNIRCEAALGLLAFGELPVGATGAFVAAYYALDQAAGAVEPAYGREQRLLPGAPWARRPLDGGDALVASLSAVGRARLLERPLVDLALLTAPLALPRPELAGGRGFRVVVAGAGGRRSAPILVGALATSTVDPVATPQ